MEAGVELAHKILTPEGQNHSQSSFSMLNISIAKQDIKLFLLFKIKIIF
jgi:hypothetical protein